jgi:hypothetical protein
LVHILTQRLNEEVDRVMRKEQQNV